MIHTGILKSWYAESVNFMVVLTFLCKMFHMCIPAVVTLVLYELFLLYIQLGKRSILMWVSVCNISVTTETLLLGTTAKNLAWSCLHSPFGHVDALMRSPHPSPHIPTLWPSAGLPSMSMSLLLRSTGPDAVFQVLPHQCWAEGQHHLLCLAASTPPDAVQDTICLLCCRGMFLAHGQCGVPEDIHFPFLLGCFPAVQLPVCTGAWSCSSPRSRLDASLF